MDKKIIILGFAGLAAYLLMSRANAAYTSQYSQIDQAPDDEAMPDPEPVEEIQYTMNVTNPTRGERNNNPGNIRKGPAWQGLAAEQPDSAFATFTKPEYGIRALGKLLQNYQASGLNTVRMIINKYAPPGENDTGAYVNAVSSNVGVTPDQPINLNDLNTLHAVVSAIIQHENGRNIYADNGVIDGGLSMIA